VRRSTSRLVVAAACIVALAAAAGAGLAASDSGKVRRGGTLVFAGASDPTYLDPALVSDGESFRVTKQIFEGLVELKPGTTRVQPALARSWKVGRDGKTWTFRLRRGVRFHDGTPFNAAAVCFNFNRQYNFRGPFQDASASYYWQNIFGGYRRNESSSLSPSLYRSCRAKGRYTAVIKLRKRSGPFIPSLVISSFAIQSPTALRRYNANRGELRAGTFYPTGSYAFSHPTGTGPYVFRSWRVGEKVELVRNPRYWGKKPGISRLIIRPISNNTARLQALQTGEVNGYDLVQPQDVATIRRNNRLKLVNRPPFNVGYVTINSAHPPFNNVLVRRAVAYGLDRRSVVRSFYGGRGTVAHEFMPPSIPFGYARNVQRYPFNPERAKALLRRAGLSLPVKVDFWYPTNVSRPYMPNPKLNFEAFSASLERSGFNVVAHSAPWRPDYVKHVNDGTAGDLNLIGWTGDYGDPDNFVGTFFQSYSPQFGFRNPRLFRILDRAESTVSIKKRAALYEQANRLIARLVPAVPYVHTRPALGFQRRVRGYVPSPVGTEPFSTVFFGGA
jgi:peptide/nickel transport system substrate-binding protein